MGMGKFCDPNENEVEVEEKGGGEKITRKEEKKDDWLVNKELKRLAQTTQVLQLITLAATLSVSKAEEGEKADADGSFSFEIIVIYTLLVIFLTLVAQRLLDVAVRGAKFVIRQCVLRAQPGSHARSRTCRSATSSTWCSEIKSECSATRSRTRKPQTNKFTIYRPHKCIGCLASTWRIDARLWSRVERDWTGRTIGTRGAYSSSSRWPSPRTSSTSNCATQRPNTGITRTSI